MQFLYIVQSGDTLAYIAQRFGITLQRLSRANNLPLLYPVYIGQELNIPIDNNYKTMYGSVPTYPLTGPDYAIANEFSITTPNNIDSETIENIIGKKGLLIDDVLKFTFARYDLKVNVGLVSLEPEFALTSWMAFHQVNGYSMVMGDLALLETEIEPAISQLNVYGLEIAALHNHLIYELPRIMFLHLSGMGDPIKLAQGIKNVLSASQTPLMGNTTSPTLPPEYWSSVEAIMRKKGTSIGRVLQFTFQRADIIREFEVVIPPSLGISQEINFQAEGQNAAVTGDFVLIAEEVNSVIRVLRQYGISITALHNHMLYEYPRLFFLHFWAVDDANKLAYGLMQALEQTNTVIG